MKMLIENIVLYGLAIFFIGLLLFGFYIVIVPPKKSKGGITEPKKPDLKKR